MFVGIGGADLRIDRIFTAKVALRQNAGQAKWGCKGENGYPLRL